MTWRYVPGLLTWRYVPELPAPVQAKPPAVPPVKRPRKKPKWIELDRRLALYERDGWICQLCLESVDPAVRNPAYRSPTLDHIIPRTRVELLPPGVDIHDERNLRLAHWGCNVRRSNQVTAAEIAAVLALCAL